MPRPEPSDYHSFYAGYVARVVEDDVVSALEDQAAGTLTLLSTIEEARAGHRYADGKWSIREVIGHIVDSERIMAYRALAIARGETKPLPGFDENAYVREARFDRFRLAELTEQYEIGRRSTVMLLRSFAPEAWSRRGIANDNSVTVNALAWIILGHERHHLSVLRERYGVAAAV